MISGSEEESSITLPSPPTSSPNEFKSSDAFGTYLRSLPPSSPSDSRNFSDETETLLPPLKVSHMTSVPTNNTTVKFSCPVIQSGINPSIGPHKVRENSDLGGILTHDRRIRSPLLHRGLLPFLPCSSVGGHRGLLPFFIRSDDGLTLETSAF